MSSRNTVIRSLHDLGAAAWFGGSLMGAVGLNAAAGKAKDPTERVRLSTLGWASWTPVQIAAIAAHAIGGIGLIAANRGRLAHDGGSQANTVAKLGITAAAAGVSIYAGVLGARMARHIGEGAEGSVTPGEDSSEELATAQQQLKIAQVALPVLTGLIVVLAAQQGEQQREPQGLTDKLRATLS